MRSTLRRRLLGATVAAMALTAVSVGPAHADGATTTTFTLTGAGLAVSAPASANLSASTGIGTASLSAQLGGVTVADNRGALLTSWTASVISTDFVTGGGGANKTITAANVTYSSGLATATSGVGVDVPMAAPLTLDQSRTAFAHTGVIGSQSTTWDPTVTVSVPTNVIAGTYSGTITHSVA